jgi:cytochrome b
MTSFHSIPPKVAVWDLPVRLFHWGLVVLLALLWLTGEIGGLDLDLPLPGGGIFLANMDLHMLLGQTVLALVIFRVLWGLVGSTTARFATFVRGPAAVMAYLKAIAHGQLPQATSHNPAGALMVLLLLGLLIAQTGTGLFASDDIFSQGPLAHLVSSDTSALLTRIHGLLFYLLLAASAIHVAAVIYYLLRGKNLIGAMITGRKPASSISPEDPTPVRMASPWLALLLLMLAGLAVWALRLL